MAFITCNLYKGYVFIIVYWLAEMIRAIVRIIFIRRLKNREIYYNKENFIIENELLSLICLNLADLLAGFLVLYTKVKMKSLTFNKKNEKKIKINKIKPSLIYNELTKIKHKVYLIILISVLDYLARSLKFFASLTKKPRLKSRQIDWMISFDIITRIFLCIIILKIKVQKHHKLAIILCLIGFILLSISDIISIKMRNMNFNDIIIYIIIIFPKSILFPLEDVVNKILLTNDYLLPHSLIFRRGVYQFGLFFIIIPFLYSKSLITFEYFNELKKINIIIYSIIFIFISFLRNICLMNVIYIFNIHYVSFLLAIIIFDNTIRQFFEEDSIYDFTQIKGIIYFIVDIIALLIISLGTLIFNEMIVINAYGLNEKTKMGLLIEEQLENSNNFESFYFAEEGEEIINNNKKGNEKIKTIIIGNNENIIDLDKENQEKNLSF